MHFEEISNYVCVTKQITLISNNCAISEEINISSIINFIKLSNI